MCWNASRISDLLAQHRGADIQSKVCNRGRRYAPWQQRTDMAETTRSKQRCESCQSKTYFLFCSTLLGRSGVISLSNVAHELVPTILEPFKINMT